MDAVNAREKPVMWQCSNCRDTVLDEFEICSNCGRVRDKLVDAELESEPEEDPDEKTDVAPTSPLPSPSFPVMSSGGMNRREIATIVVRSLSLIIFAQVAYYALAAIMLLNTHVVTASHRERDWYHVPAVLFFSMLSGGAVAALLYWVKGPAIAARMVPGNPAPVMRLSFNVRDAMIVAFSMAGLFMLLDGLRQLLGVLHFSLYYDAMDYQPWTMPRTWKALAQLALAWWLVVGSPGVVGLIDTLRCAHGRDNRSEPATEDGGVSDERC